MTDIFGKEERKEMLTRIERMELLNNETTKAIASINDALREINGKLDAKPEVVAEPQLEYSAIDTPTPAETLRGVIDEQNGILKEIRSNIAETNSLLTSMMRSLNNIDTKLTDAVLRPQQPVCPTQTPPLPPSPSWTISNKGTGDDKPYIPKSTYIDDSITPIDEEKEE